jgi:uncharacterized membrane protein
VIPQPKYQQIIFVLLPLMYLSGAVGLHIDSVSFIFSTLTPLNLIVSLVFLIWFCPNRTPIFWLYAGVTFSVGFFVEVIGVKTGVIFGQYWYGTTLGPKILNVPITIGCNWLMLNYSANVIANKIPFPNLLKAAFAALLMTLLDVLIEPVAMKLSFWNWANDSVPFQNYGAWFLISFLLSATFFQSNISRNNRLAALLFALQVLFFLLNSFFV